jgi:methionyl-tRNA synthetase
MDEIDVKDFLKIDLRVARIEQAESVEDADKLIKLILDLGNEEKKQVFAGIKKFYEPEDLVGKLVICVANLKSREMRFGTSEGMILAASNENSGVYVLNPDDGAKPGMKVS